LLLPIRLSIHVYLPVFPTRFFSMQWLIGLDWRGVADRKHHKRQISRTGISGETEKKYSFQLVQYCPADWNFAFSLVNLFYYSNYRRLRVFSRFLAQAFFCHNNVPPYPRLSNTPWETVTQFSPAFNSTATFRLPCLLKLWF